MADNDSMYNTAPTYSIYITGLVMDWLLAEGGVAEMDRRSHRKAALCVQRHPYICVFVLS